MVYSKKTIVVNPTGIHARPASTFVMKAREYESEVLVRNVTKDGAYVRLVQVVQYALLRRPERDQGRRLCERGLHHVGDGAGALLRHRDRGRRRGPRRAGGR